MELFCMLNSRHVRSLPTLIELRHITLQNGPPRLGELDWQMCLSHEKILQHLKHILKCILFYVTVKSYY